MRFTAYVLFVAMVGFGTAAIAQTATITNCPGNYSFNHCGFGMYDFNAEGEGDISFELVSGPGSIDQTSGVWVWDDATIPHSGIHSIQVAAYDDNGQGNVCNVQVAVSNHQPKIECPSTPIMAYLDETTNVDVSVSDLDACDELEVSVLSLYDGATAGDIVAVNGTTVSFTPENTGNGRFVSAEIEVSDGIATNACTLHFIVPVSGRPPSIAIGVENDQPMGQYTQLDVTLYSIDRSQGFAGFEFLFAYDASVLSLPSAAEGDVYDACGWEYFTYRNVDACSGACPSGLFRVIGVGNLNNGYSTPGCDSPDPGYVQKDQLPITLFSLKFMVSNNRTNECQFVPVKFFWMVCEDNVVSNRAGSELYLSAKVFDYEGDESLFEAGEVTGDGSQEFPTFLGAADSCVYVDYEDEKVAVPTLYYQNGGVGIACTEVYLGRGDINRNNTAFEIADAIMFTNYFHIGLAAFGNHPEESVNASDTNADGLPLTIGDLVHLIRVVTGEIPPY